MLDNETIRVNKSLTGTVDQMVIDIFRNDLQSKKNLIVEETRGVRKYVMPRKKPFETISYYHRRQNHRNMLQVVCYFTKTQQDLDLEV